MRSGIIGLIIGVVLGIVIGATVIAPRLHPPPRTAATPPPPAEVARELPKLLLPRPAVEWKLAGVWEGAVPLAGSLAKRLDRVIAEASRGQMEVRFFEPGVLVPSSDLFAAVAAGAVDAGFGPPAMLAPALPALQVYGGVPFGPRADEFLAWLEFGGGADLLNEITEARGVHALVCGLLPEAAAGWFGKEIGTAADLRGLKMSIDGLGARVLQRLGVEVRALAPAALVPALEAGSIEAAALSTPAIDRHFKLQTRLKYYYFPGWQQPTSALLLVINLQRWQALKSTERVLIETACGDNVSAALAEGEALQFAALKELYAAGVQFERWPPVIREELRQSWLQIAEELANGDAEFRRVWKSLTAFRDQYGVWGGLSSR